MQKYLKFIVFSMLASVLLYSCVPQKKLEEEQAKRQDCEKQLATLKASSQDCETKSTELQAKVDDNEKQIKGLREDTSIIGTNYRNLTDKYDKLNDINEELLSKYNMLLKGNEADTKKLSGQLQLTQDQLLKKQDSLRGLQITLMAEKERLDSLSAELQKREARVNQLESILKKKDDAVKALKEKVSQALLGFKNKGLSVEEKNGKIYVSLEESLLFASGSIKVEPKGVQALKELENVLVQNPDINIMVEGHTDDVPMNGRGEIKDNWDLSVLRATSIVKLLTKDKKIDPKRLIAAGRGPYMPVAKGDTPEARRKNRRTDIILTPKLDELFKILDTNN